MTVLVTGGAGYIGSHVVLELLGTGEKVIVLDNLSTGFRDSVADGSLFVEGDVGDASLLRSIFREHQPDAVLHFAGSVVVPDSVRDPLSYYLNNTVKTHVLISECVTNKVKSFIFSSTAAVYGNSVSDEPVLESATTAPESPYGYSKLMTEIMLRDTAAASDFNYIALRYFNVSGADPMGRVGQSTFGATHLLKVACEVAVGKRPSISVFGTDYPTFDGTCIRDFIHVSDLAEAHVIALKRIRTKKQSAVMNCGYGQGFSVNQILEAVERISGVKLKRINAARRLGDAVSVVSNPRLLNDTLLWYPKYNDLDIIVSTALEWERKTM